MVGSTVVAARRVEPARRREGARGSVAVAARRTEENRGREEVVRGSGV